MSGCERFLLQLFGSVYALYSILKLLWTFIRRPFQCLQTLKKSSRDVPSCLVDERYGVHEFITIKGLKYHYVINGNEDKPLMIFIHGFPDFWYAWRNQIEEFSKNYRTVAIDLRGFGDTDTPEDVTDYSTIKLREDIADLVLALKYKSCILVAHDIGGTVAYHVATKFPEIVNKLIILNSPHPAVFLDVMKTNKSQKKKSWYMIMFQVPYVPECILPIFDFILLREMCGGSLGSAKSHDDLDAYRYMFLRSGLTGQLNFYRAALSYRTTDTVRSQIEVPTLLIWGTNDTLLEMEMVEMNRKYIPNLKIAFCNGGHWPHIDKTEEVNLTITEFLEQKD